LASGFSPVEEESGRRNRFNDFSGILVAQDPVPTNLSPDLMRNVSRQCEGVLPSRWAAAT